MVTPFFSVVYFAAHLLNIANGKKKKEGSDGLSIIKLSVITYWIYYVCYIRPLISEIPHITPKEKSLTLTS